METFTKYLAVAIGSMLGGLLRYYLGGSVLSRIAAPFPFATFFINVTSQFEQQLRAVCGLPLGSTELLKPAAMANLLGDLWENGEPDWIKALEFPDVKLHLYGKTEARRGRKMGHLTALAETADDAAKIVREARNALTEKRLEAEN